MKYKTATLTESGQVGSGAVRLRRVVIGAQTDNAKAIFDNSANGSGTALLTVNALANDGREVKLESVGGLEFPTACYCTLSGTAAIVYVWYE